MGLMPVKSSPDVVLMSGLNEWNHSEKPGVSQGLSRIVSLIAYPIIALLGAVYNAVAFTVKAPLTLFRYTFGFIPTKGGKVADLLPEDTSMKHMAWHLYKVLFSVFDIFPCYPLAVIHPEANIALHTKMGLVPAEAVRFVPKSEAKGGDSIAESDTPFIPAAPGSIPAPPDITKLGTFKLKTWKEKQEEAKAKGTTEGNESKEGSSKTKKSQGFGGFDPKENPLFKKLQKELV